MWYLTVCFNYIYGRATTLVNIVNTVPWTTKTGKFKTKASKYKLLYMKKMTMYALQFTL